MNRSMILIGVLLVALVIAMIYQQQKGVERPWTQCKESMIAQMLTGECAPSQFSTPSHTRPTARRAPNGHTPDQHPPDRRLRRRPAGGYVERRYHLALKLSKIPPWGGNPWIWARCHRA